MYRIRIQAEPIALATEQEALWQGDFGAGAVVTFIGLMRDFNAEMAVSQMTLEHYPGMTERVFTELVAIAINRWVLRRITLIHRIGTLAIQDPIVFIGVTSAHRSDAFNACQFLIDELKTRAPLWKKEQTIQGARWVTTHTCLE
ncbi:molybdenum cofactor biosynthesis protein MoaE [Chromatium weissei]|nr:molybdenum cofactor biosynthesis protein MoaE [Chromatium weissei]